MEKLRKLIGKHLPAIAVIVLAMAVTVVAACQGEYCIRQKNFKIEKMYMTRICVDSFPAAPALMYLVESAISDCPPETIRSDGRYRALPPYFGGSIDTIVSVEFTNKGNEIFPTQLHWQDCYEIMIASKGIRIDTTQQNWQNSADSLDASIYLYKEGETIDFSGTIYIADYRYLPRLMIEPRSKFNTCSYDTCYRSLTYLVCFDKKSPLVESGIVKCKNREIKIVVNNTPMKLKYAKPIHHFGPVN